MLEERSFVILLGGDYELVSWLGIPCWLNLALLAI